MLKIRNTHTRKEIEAHTYYFQQPLVELHASNNIKGLGKVLS